MNYAGDPSVDLDAAIADAVLRELLGAVPGASRPLGRDGEDRAAVIEAVIAAAWPDATTPTVDELAVDPASGAIIMESWAPVAGEPFVAVDSHAPDATGIQDPSTVSGDVP